MPGEAPNLLLVDAGRDPRDFSAGVPGERLVTDITEFRLGGRAQGPPVGDGPPLRRARGGLEVRGLPSAALATGTLEDAVVARALRAGGRHPLDVQEGPLAQQRRHGGLLRKAQGGDVRGRDWSGWTPDAFAGELAAYICWCNASRIRALREGGRTVWDTTDGRRRRLGTAA